jgi:hypothetical protein
MQPGRSFALSSLFWLMAASAAVAGHARGVTLPGDPAYIGTVEVVQDDPKAPEGFADLLRAAVLQEAALYGETGTPVTLKIEVSKVHMKNAMQAMLVGDDNATKGHVDVVDPASGAQLGTFKIQVNAERRSHTGENIALFIVGAIDPTGAVDISSRVAQGARSTNHSAAEVAMSENFAAEALRQTFGDARAKAVRAAKSKPPAPKPPAP